MADEKIASLRVDASQATAEVDKLGNSFAATGDKAAQAAAIVGKTETQVKNLASSSREYNTAARMVGASVQSITKFERAYQAALKDTSNASQVKANILAAAYARSIGGAADEAKAVELLKAGHVKAAEGVRFMNMHGAAMNRTMIAGANATRRNTAQMQNFYYQVNDVFSGLAMGQAPMQILAQQGGQITQALGGVTSTLKYLVNPYVAAAAAAATLGAAFWSSHASMKALDTALRTSNGAVGLSKSELLDLSKQLASTGAVSVSEGRKIEQAIVAAGTVGGANFTALAKSAASAGQMMGVDAADAAKTLAEAMGDPAKAAETLNGKYWTLSASQIRHIGEMARSGELEQAQATLIEAMTAKISGAAQETSLWTRAVNGLSNAWNGLANVMSGGALDSIADKIEAAQKRIAELEKQRTDVRYAGFQARIEAEIAAKNDEIKALRAQLEQDKAAAASAKIYGANQAEIKVGTKISDAIVPGGDRKGLEAQQGTLTNAWMSAMGSGDAEAANLKASLDAVNRALDTYITEGERANLVTKAQAEATRLGGAEGQRYLKIESDRIANLGKVVDLGELEKKSLAVRTAANAEYAQAMVAQGKTLSEAQIAATTTAQTESLNRERQALAQRKALGEITAEEELAQALDIEDRKRAVEEAAARAKFDLLKRTAGTQLTEIDAAEKAVTALVLKNATERQKQVDAITAAQAARSRSQALMGAEGQAQTGGIAADSKAEDLRHAQAMGEITSLQEIADAERQIANERLQIQLALIDAKLAAAVHGSDEERRLLNERVATERRTAAQIKAIDNRATEARLGEVRSWTEPTKTAMNGMVQGVFQGTQRVSQLIGSFGRSIVASYANMAAQAVMAWIEKHVILAAWNAMFGQKEIAQAAATETAVTGIKAAGASAQVGVVAGGQVAEAGAVAAGEVTKNSERAAGESVGLGIKGTGAISSIAMSAYEAAAGAYAAIASIPYIGPFLAPAAAATALAAVFAFGKSIFSAEGGWGEVPHDGAQTVLHKKEMVLPAKYAVPLRAALTSGSGFDMASLATAGMGKMPDMAALQAGAGLSLPRYGLPDFINKRPDFTRAQNSNTTTNRDESRTTISPTFNINAMDGASVKQMLLDNEGPIATALAKAVRNGNRDARYVSGRK